MAKERIEITVDDSKSTVLIEAHEVVNGDRNVAYGEPEEVFESYAVGWSVIIGAPVTAKQVAMCMAWLKLMREKASHKHDNLVDLAGYTEIIDRLS